APSRLVAHLHEVPGRILRLPPGQEAVALLAGKGIPKRHSPSRIAGYCGWSYRWASLPRLWCWLRWPYSVFCRWTKLRHRPRMCPRRLYPYTNNVVSTGYSPNLPISAESWHHVAVVRNPPNIAVFIDGKSYSAAKINERVKTGSASLCI